ncbi:ABC transporter ATP-binding protein [Nocardia sp. IFM 10818]
MGKSYGGLRAVDGVSFAVRAGEIFGMIGPNGAGKTTLMECVEGMRRPDAGTIEVLGLDPIGDARELRERIGIQLQSAALPTRVKTGEALELFASFYDQPADWRALLTRLGLRGKANVYIDKLSGGQRQRVFIALALLNNPDVVFLDELTTALDPQARLAIWDIIRDIRDRGATVFLTTHSMAEAEQLCDRVAIVDHGRLVALGTVPELVAGIAAESSLSFTVAGEAPIDRIGAVAGVTRIDRSGSRITVHGKGNRYPQGVIEVLSAADLWARDLRTDQAGLEEVFLALTGRRMREERAA